MELWRPLNPPFSLSCLSISADVRGVCAPARVLSHENQIILPSLPLPSMKRGWWSGCERVGGTLSSHWSSLPGLERRANQGQPEVRDKVEAHSHRDSRTAGSGLDGGLGGCKSLETGRPGPVSLRSPPVLALWFAPAHAARQTYLRDHHFHHPPWLREETKPRAEQHQVGRPWPDHKSLLVPPPTHPAK